MLKIIFSYIFSPYFWHSFLGKFFSFEAEKRPHDKRFTEVQK